MIKLLSNSLLFIPPGVFVVLFVFKNYFSSRSRIFKHKGFPNSYEQGRTLHGGGGGGEELTLRIFNLYRVLFHVLCMLR